MDLANVDEEISWNTLQSLGKEHNQHNLGKLLKFLNHPKPELRGFWGDSLAKLSHWGPKLNFWTSKNSTKQATFVLFQLKMVVSHQLHLGIKGGMIQVCSKNSTAAIYLHTSLTLESSTYSNFLSSSYPSSNCTWHYRSFSQLFTSCIHRLIHMLSYLYIIYIYTVHKLSSTKITPSLLLRVFVKAVTNDSSMRGLYQGPNRYIATFSRTRATTQLRRGISDLTRWHPLCRARCHGYHDFEISNTSLPCV